MRMRNKLCTSLARLFPLGWPWQRELAAVGGALALSALAAALGFHWRFNSALNALYDKKGTISVLVPGRSVPAFPVVFDRALLWFWVTALCILLTPIFHYLWHKWGGSQSIYLMRRLPRRSELWRRCLAGSALLLALCALAAGLVVLLCFWAYGALTPAGHLPEDVWAGMGGTLCWF